MTAPPPDDPDGPRDGRDLDFDAEFERIVADWQPSAPDTTESESDPSTAEPGSSPVEPVEAPSDNDNLRNLFRSAWGDEGGDQHPSSAEPGETPDEHFVPPPAPPLPRPEPRRLIAWAGLLGAPMVGLVLLVLGALPAFASFLLFCWFVGGFGYLVATMNERGHDGWDNGAQV